MFCYASIVRTFAQHRDDRRRVEKAFIESTGLASGKVIELVEMLFGSSNNFAVSLFLTPQDDAIPLSQFGFDDFYRFYKKLTGRQEVEKIFEEL